MGGTGRLPGGEVLLVAALRLACLGLLLLLWSVAAQHVPRGLVPGPLDTWEAAQRLVAEGRLQAALIDSLSVFASGYGAAILIAIPAGLAMGAFRLLGRTLEVFVYALAATPRVAFIPLIIVLLGLGFQAKVFIVYLGAIMPILLNTYTGVLQADEDLIEMARSVGAPRRRIFARIILPGAMPYIVTGLRLGATIGLINTVVAELYTATRGLGGLLSLYGGSFRMAEYFVVVLTLAAIGVCVTEALRHLEAQLARWRT